MTSAGNFGAVAMLAACHVPWPDVQRGLVLVAIGFAAWDLAALRTREPLPHEAKLRILGFLALACAASGAPPWLGMGVGIVATGSAMLLAGTTAGNAWSRIGLGIAAGCPGLVSILIAAMRMA